MSVYSSELAPPPPLPQASVSPFWNQRGATLAYGVRVDSRVLSSLRCGHCGEHNHPSAFQLVVFLPKPVVQIVQMDRP